MEAVRSQGGTGLDKGRAALDKDGLDKRPFVKNSK